MTAEIGVLKSERERIHEEFSKISGQNESLMKELATLQKLETERNEKEKVDQDF